MPLARGVAPAGVPVVAVATGGEARRAFVAQIMGLPVSVHVRGPRARSEPVAAAVEQAFEELRAADRTFSTYRSASAVSRIQRGELALPDAGPDVREVAELCEEAGRRTQGAFTAWLPGPDGPRFDPTGLVKGWAAERAFAGLTDRLAALGAHDVLLSAGGDVVVACGRTDTPDWLVAVEDPRDRARTLTTVPLRRGAVATSGTAARGAHIVDPRTRQPAAQLRSATVVGPSLLWADVYATAAFVRGRAAATWLPTLGQHAGVLVHADGTVVLAQGPA